MQILVFSSGLRRRKTGGDPQVEKSCSDTNAMEVTYNTNEDKRTAFREYETRHPNKSSRVLKLAVS